MKHQPTMKRMKKILSLLLVCMLILNSMALYAVGEEALPTETETASDVALSDVIAEKYDVGDEIVEWREEGVKHYYLGDGKYQAVVKAGEMKNSVQSRSSSTTVNSSRYPLDTYLSSSNKAACYGESEEVWVGTTYIGLFYNGKPNLPTNAIIESATMSFSYYYHVSTGSMTVGAYAVEEYWDEYTVTWNEMAAYPDMGISTTPSGTVILSASSTDSENTPTRASVNITDIVRSWYSKERSNEGIALKRIGGSNTSVILKSYESEDEDHFAYYVITYSTLDEVMVPKGEYYLFNQKYEKYIQPDESVSGTTEGAEIEIWDFNGSFNQRWNIVYLYNGYYKILSTIGNKALTAPTTTDSPITQTTYTGNYRQQWKILQNSDGTYRFYSRSATSYCMVAGSELLVVNGRKVKLRTSQNDDRDDWVLEPLNDYREHSLKVRIYYDDSLPYTEDQILEFYRDAVEEFVSEFGIVFEMPIIEYLPSLNVSTSCCYKSNLKKHCDDNCGSEYQCSSLHHKSAGRLIPLNTSNTYYTIRLVGYATCNNGSDGHEEVWGLGYVNGRNSVVSAQSSHIVETIQHELTHNLGQGHNNCSSFQRCVLEGAVDHWCDSCREAINNNIN